MRIMIALIAIVLAATSADAHLMVAQRGTLNFVNDSAYLVLSVPVSAFVRIDDNDDGAVSIVEFNRHRNEILESVLARVALSDRESRYSLESAMLSPVIPHGVNAATTTLTQVVVMGRFSVSNANSQLRFTADVFGHTDVERSLLITAIRKSDQYRHQMTLTPEHSSGQVFSN